MVLLRKEGRRQQSSCLGEYCGGNTRIQAADLLDGVVVVDGWWRRNVISHFLGPRPGLTFRSFRRLWRIRSFETVWWIRSFEWWRIRSFG